MHALKLWNWVSLVVTSCHPSSKFFSITTRLACFCSYCLFNIRKFEHSSLSLVLNFSFSIVRVDLLRIVDYSKIFTFSSSYFTTFTWSNKNTLTCLGPSTSKQSSSSKSLLSSMCSSQWDVCYEEEVLQFPFKEIEGLLALFICSYVV
jgi:hypothetical protein